MIWLVFALMVGTVLAILLLPLARAGATAAPRVAFDMAVYTDQLAEVARDVERGLLTGDQAEAARTEIQRRMLAAADRKETPQAAGAPPRKLMAAVAVTVPLVAFGLYAVLGSPGLPDQPYAARAGKIQQMRDQVAMFRGMVENFQAKLRANPADGPGWAMLGRSLRVLGEPAEAREAYAKALPLLPGDIKVRLDYAGLLIDNVPDGAPLPPAFVDVMREILALDGENPDALYFVGQAEAQAGNPALARGLWTRLLAKLPPKSADRAEVQKKIDALR